MAEVRVKVPVNLPTFERVIDHEDGTWTVRVPDDECEDGTISEACIREKYRGQEKWDKPDAIKGVVIASS